MRPSKVKNDSSDQSDSDDWTLLTPPNSSSPKLPECLDLIEETKSTAKLETYPVEVKFEDGLTEIDLNAEDKQSEGLDTSQEHSTKAAEEKGLEDSTTEFLDIVSRFLTGPVEAPICSKRKKKRKILRCVPTASVLATSCKVKVSPNNQKVAVQHATKVKRTLYANPKLSKGDETSRLSLLELVCCLMIVYFMYCLVELYYFRVKGVSLDVHIPKANLVDLNHSSLGDLSFVREMKLMHQQLEECVKRQEYKIDRSHPLSTMSQGLVCRGQEPYWRARFDILKSVYGIDFRQIVQQVKNNLPDESLTLKIDGTNSFKIKLLIHQMEYLDRLNTTLVKKQLEDTIKFLKAENSQLSERLKSPNEAGFQKLFIGMEIENSKLVHENEALRANLLKKVGPVYMKKVQETEKFERENVILKQFYFQISQDISKSLKRLSLHSIETSNILDDQENLSSKLMLTRGNLRRLGEKIGTISVENEGLREELKEIYYSTSSNKANLPATHGGYSKTGRDNDSRALIVDDCRRNLIELREESRKLQTEIDRLRKSCSNRTINVGLEVSSERHLNRTNNINVQPAINWEQFSSLERSFDKPSEDMDMLSLGNGDIVDDLMVFLTKFNNHIESNGLAKIEGDSQLVHDSDHSHASYDKDNTEAKVIPNYIRDAVRKKSEKDENCHLAELKVAHQLPPISPLLHFKVSTHTDNLPDGSKVTKTLLNDEKVSSYNVNNSKLVKNDASHKSRVPEYPSLPNPPILRDTWFFKRAKQRKQLRGDKNAPNRSDWSMKRAYLREKLRRASSYIDEQYQTEKYSPNKKRKLKKNLDDCERHHSYTEIKLRQKSKSIKKIYTHDEL